MGSMPPVLLVQRVSQEGQGSMEKRETQDYQEGPELTETVDQTELPV